MKIIKDPIVIPILQNLPSGYSLVCCRCGKRNGLHDSYCTNPGVIRGLGK